MSTPHPDAQVAETLPTGSLECNQHAARILLFSERETDSRLFDQYMTLAQAWMELAAGMGDSSG